MCSTVSETGRPPRQAFDLPVQHRFVRPTLATVSQARSGPAHDAADPPLGYFIPLVQVIGGGPLPVRAHHFFFAMSCSIVLSRNSSATSLLRRSTSAPVPGIGDRYRPGRERVAVANDSKSSRQCRVYDKSPRLSVLWPDRGRLRVAIARPRRRSFACSWVPPGVTLPRDSHFGWTNFWGADQREGSQTRLAAFDKCSSGRNICQLQRLPPSRRQDSLLAD